MESEDTNKMIAIVRRMGDLHYDQNGEEIFHSGGMTEEQLHETTVKIMKTKITIDNKVNG